MAGLNPSVKAFVPGGSSFKEKSYSRSDEKQWYPPQPYYDHGVRSHWDEYDKLDDRHYQRTFEPIHENEPAHDLASGFPTREELRDFYQELQNGGWKNQTDWTPKSRGFSTRQAQRSPPRATSMPPQAGSRGTTLPQPGPRCMTPQPGPRCMTPQPTLRRSPPRRSPPNRRVSPKSFANVARNSLERKSAPSTPSPTTESRTQNEAIGGLNAHESRERRSTKSAERKHSPPKIDVSYDADAEVNLIRSQLEFYFSDKNLQEENNSNLIFYMLHDKMWVPLHVVCALPKIRDIGGKKEDVLNALRTSSLLELNDAENKVRRPGYQLPPDFKVRKSLRRSVLVYGLPQQMTDAGLRNLLKMHGNILCVAFPNQNDGPDIEMGRIIMKKKLGEPSNLMKLNCAFVVFESQSQANKCVKARSRSAPDNIRTMHKYDYNKVVKRLGKGMSPNSSPLWTPTASPSFNSEPRSSSLTGATPTFNSVPGGLKLSPAHGAHNSPHFGSRSMSRSPVVRSTNSRSPFYRSNGSPNVRSQRSPSWKLEGNGDISSLRQRSNSMQNRRVIVAKGPDNTKGFRWPRNPHWRSKRTALDVLNTTMV